MNGKVLALDIATGAVRWIYAASKPVFASPTVHRGLVHVGAKDGKLHVIDAATGQARRFFGAGSTVDGSAAVTPNGLLVFAGFDGTVRALD